MRAVWYERLGPAREVLQFGEMPDPQPAPGEVRVRVAYSGVNPSDVKRRAGSNVAAMPFPRVIPDMDGSGVIDRVGAGVDERRIGERVWLHSTQWKRPHGTGAEYAVTPGARAIALPGNISLEAGASLGVPAMTAHRAVFGCGSVTGKTVLVTGGAGAVGFYAIQLAKWGGARVIATVSGEDKAALASKAGADAVVNYKRAKVEEAVDHVVEVDFGANLAQTLACVRDGGSIATYASMGKPEPALPFYPMMFKNLRLLWVFVYEMPAEAIEAAARDVNAWLIAGRALLPPFTRFPLERLADAHVAVEQGAVGKVLVQCGPGG
ncbi:MAG TPA: NADPH:quinone reductase [Burkholderiales bacterium]|jgi:NADPH2:quinone reductase|nr:NADPH:quinone reductase [Burkholderiales bacterium]